MTPMEKRMADVTEKILRDYQGGRDIDRLDALCHPDKGAVIAVTGKLMGMIYPGYSRDGSSRMPGSQQALSIQAADVMESLGKQILLVLRADMGDAAGERAQEICLEFLSRIPALRAVAQTDVDAAYEGDPAAKSRDEIIFCYPGLFAVTVYRLAHVLYTLNVPMIPRIMTEHAHSVTGIDIHPGAEIGEYFFIDHGTGIVIGETTVIGRGVKIYQGVTLGGLSTRGGQSLRGVKRHPTIEDNVTIYANASILGGSTVIGRDSVIGASAFITASVPPCTTVTTKMQELQFKPRPCGDCSRAEPFWEGQRPELEKR